MTNNKKRERKKYVTTSLYFVCVFPSHYCVNSESRNDYILAVLLLDGMSS